MGAVCSINQTDDNQSNASTAICDASLRTNDPGKCVSSKICDYHERARAVSLVKHEFVSIELDSLSLNRDPSPVHLDILKDESNDVYEVDKADHEDVGSPGIIDTAHESTEDLSDDVVAERDRIIVFEDDESESRSIISKERSSPRDRVDSVSQYAHDADVESNVENELVSDFPIEENRKIIDIDPESRNDNEESGVLSLGLKMNNQSTDSNTKEDELSNHSVFDSSCEDYDRLLCLNEGGDIDLNEMDLQLVNKVFI